MSRVGQWTESKVVAPQGALCLLRPQRWRFGQKRRAARRPAATRKVMSPADCGLRRGVFLGDPWDSDPVRPGAPCSASGSGSALTVHTAGASFLQLCREC